MSVLVVGLSHRTAPVPVLERVTLGVGDTTSVLEALTVGTVREAVIVATCNRVEVYADTDKFHEGVNAVSDLLASRSGVPLDELAGHLYVHWEDQAVLHLFQVACGLDSMVVGESQILGQLRRAYAAAGRGAGRILHELFQQSLHVGKRAHAETGIDDAGRSLVSVAVDTALSSAGLGSLRGASALVVGAGSMGALAGATLRRAGVTDIVVANRSADNARRLADTLEGRGIGIADLGPVLARVDIVVTSTGATGTVLGIEEVRAAVAERGGRPLVILDLALPRDVEPGVADLPGVTLVDLESLQTLLDDSQTGADVSAVREIVDDEVVAFLASQRANRVAPTVAALRSRADQVVSAELLRLTGRLPDLDDRSRAEVETAVRRVVDKLLHTPTVRVKELADAVGGVSYTEALQTLFGLDRATPAALTTTPLATTLLTAEQESA